MNINELKKTAHEALESLIDEMARRGIPIECPDVILKTVKTLDPDHGDHEYVEYRAELLEMVDGRWTIEEYTYDA